MRTCQVKLVIGPVHILFTSKVASNLKLFSKYTWFPSKVRIFECIAIWKSSMGYTPATLSSFEPSQIVLCSPSFLLVDPDGFYLDPDQTSESPRIRIRPSSNHGSGSDLGETPGPTFEDKTGSKSTFEKKWIRPYFKPRIRIRPKNLDSDSNL